MAAVKMNGAGPEVALKPDPDQKAGLDSEPKVMANPEIVQQQTPARSLQSEKPLRMNDLPDEIAHITENFLSLNQLLSRLAQRSHNELEDTIRTLAKKPLPTPPMLNGNTEHNAIEDSSQENLDKKITLLRFAQEQHARWVKALVITDWSKKASTLSKLIDLKVHMQKQMDKYDMVLDQLMHSKRNLAYARLPSPDLKTALEVLANSSAPWMPDLGYIPPPEMTAEEQLEWLEDLDTLLSLRLTIDDHDKIPYHFQNYRIGSGRVTFVVKGEFEVDLTIADDDPEKQYWFIDFRFLFTPAPSGLSDSLRMFLELKVNEVLAAEGLMGCYKYLHEFVLTHKINELRRQALELSRGRWVDALNIERLNRSLAVQYWTTRYPPKATAVPKSWIIIGVHSGVLPGATATAKSTSHLAIRWFRDNQEVKDVKISLDDSNLSMEKLLDDVIGLHVQNILTSIHKALCSKPRFMNKEESLALQISAGRPSDSCLVVQMTDTKSVTLRVNQIGGRIAFQPRTRQSMVAENNLNTPGRDPVPAICWLRNNFTMEELKRRGKSLGWIAIPKPPVKPDELRHLLSNFEQGDAMAWFRKQSWGSQYSVLATWSLSGDQWWLIELSNGSASAANPNLSMSMGVSRIRSYVRLQLGSNPANIESPTFFADLNYLVSAMISKMRDLRELHSRRISHIDRTYNVGNSHKRVKIPVIFIRTSEILPSLSGADAAGSRGRLGRWASDEVRLAITNVQASSSAEAESRGENRSALSTRMDSRVVIAAEARLRVLNKDMFKQLSSKVDRDVLFNHRTGEFLLQLRAELGETMVDKLMARLQTIERLYEFLQAISSATRGVECETVTLRKVVFTYSEPFQDQEPSTSQQPPRRWKVVLDFTDPRKVRLVLEKDNPHIQIIDMLQTMANSARGLENLPFYLPTTIAVYRTLDTIGDGWQQLQTARKGVFEIFNKTVDLVTVRYELPGGAAPRRLTLDVKLSARRGELCWHVKRTDAEPARSGDEFAKVLKSVWDSKSPRWKCLSTSASGPASAGVGDLLQSIDQAVRTLLDQPPQLQIQQPQKQTQPSQQQLLPPQQQQQQQQQQRPQQQPPQQQHMPPSLGQNHGNMPINRMPTRPGLPIGGPAQMRQRHVPQAPMGNNVVDLT